MKKALYLLTALLLCATMLAACTTPAPTLQATTDKPAETTAAPSAEPTQNAASAEPTPSTAPEASAPAASEQVAPPVAAPGTPAGSFTVYEQAKSQALQNIMNSISANQDLAVYSLSFMPLSLYDLGLLPISVIGQDLATGQAALSMLNLKDLKIEGSGSSYVITFTNGDGVKMKQTCDYDKATDSMRSVTTNDSGKVEMLFEYVKNGSGYAAQYYAPDEKNGSALYTCWFKGNNCAFGIQTLNKEPASIYKNTSLTSDFWKSAETWFQLTDGKLTVHDKGTDKTY